MYNIGEVSKMFNIPVSTLRYYDQEGLFPDLKKESGIRKFSEVDIETLRVIECLKKTGLEIKDIKQFMLWCKEGSSTFDKRLDLFKRQKEKILEEIKILHKTLSMIEYKCFYYETAKEHGEEYIKNLKIEDLPEDIKNSYLESHRN